MSASLQKKAHRNIRKKLVQPVQLVPPEFYAAAKPSSERRKTHSQRCRKFLSCDSLSGNSLGEIRINRKSIKLHMGRILLETK